jgi:hypothetical protein
MQRPKMASEESDPNNLEAAERPENFDLQLATFSEDPYREIDIRKRTAELFSAQGRKKAQANEKLRTWYYKTFPYWPISVRRSSFFALQNSSC